jgi:hypothetical protein
MMMGIDHPGLGALPAHPAIRQEAGCAKRGGAGENMTPGYRRAGCTPAVAASDCAIALVIVISTPRSNVIGSCRRPGSVAADGREQIGPAVLR